MLPIEYFCDVYQETFTVIGDSLFTLNEEEDEWEPVDWDIIEEDDEMNDHYSWVFSKIKRDMAKVIDNDPINQLFS